MLHALLLDGDYLFWLIVMLYGGGKLVLFYIFPKRDTHCILKKAMKSNILTVFAMVFLFVTSFLIMPQHPSSWRCFSTTTSLPSADLTSSNSTDRLVCPSLVHRPRDDQQQLPSLCPFVICIIDDPENTIKETKPPNAKRINCLLLQYLFV